MTPRGTGLIEATVAIAVTGFLIVVVAGLTNAVSVNRSSLLTAQATALAQEELEALRSLPYASLVDQTNGPILGVLTNFGRWTAESDNSNGHTGPNVLSVEPVSGAASGATGVLLLPPVPLGDGTISLKLKARTGSPANWQVGALFRVRDLRSGYLVRVDATALKLLKRTPTGTAPWYSETELYSAAQTISLDAWQEVSVALSGSSISITLNGSLLTVTPITDSTYTKGSVALFAGNGTRAAYDDIALPATAFNFDADPTGATPTDLVRVGINDLPDSTAAVPNDNAQVSIGDQIAGDADVRKFTVTVSWQERSGTKSVTLSSLRAKYGLFL
jgi:hypothetical protein